MNKTAVFLITALFAALTATAHAQAPAAGKAKSATAASDPLVQTREAEATAKKAYQQKVAAAKKERAEEMKPMIEASIKDATAKGTDPLVARRDAEKKAQGATRASYDAKVKAAKKERDAAVADARKKGAASK